MINVGGAEIAGLCFGGTKVAFLLHNKKCAYPWLVGSTLRGTSIHCYGSYDPATGSRENPIDQELSNIRASGVAFITIDPRADFVGGLDYFPYYGSIDGFPSLNEATLTGTPPDWITDRKQSDITIASRGTTVGDARTTTLPYHYDDQFGHPADGTVTFTQEANTVTREDLLTIQHDYPLKAGITPETIPHDFYSNYWTNNYVDYKTGGGRKEWMEAGEIVLAIESTDVYTSGAKVYKTMSCNSGVVTIPDDALSWIYPRPGDTAMNVLVKDNDTTESRSTVITFEYNGETKQLPITQLGKPKQ